VSDAVVNKVLPVEAVGRLGVRVAESGVEPPRTIPNRVVPGASAGEYCVGDRVGGEAVARTRAHTRRDSRFSQAARGGAVAARWAHNPKVAGSNPAPATPTSSSPPSCWAVVVV
jgi:hypothetical protein